MDIGSLVASHRADTNRVAFTFEEIEASAADRSARWSAVVGGMLRFARRIARAWPARDDLASRMPAE